MFMYGTLLILNTVFVVISTNQPNLNWLTNNRDVYCVLSNETESTAIVLLRNNRPIEATQYRLTSSNSNNQMFECAISTDSNCKNKLSNTKLWTYDLSDNYYLSPILDRRWEGLHTVKTGKRNFVNLRNFTGTETHFTVELSIKVNTNAHIYLCNGTVPSDSECYWFVIGGWDGQYSIVRMCDRNTIPEMEGEFPSDKTSCGKHPEDEIEPKKREHMPKKTFNSWSDFILTKDNNVYSVKQKLQSQEEIVRYEENGSKIMVKHLLVASPNDNPGKWKVKGADTIYETGYTQLSKYLLWEDKNTVTFKFSVIHPTNGPILIYLCKDEIAHNSFCYWITLQYMKKPQVCLVKGKLDECGAALIINESIANLTSLEHFTLRKNNNNYSLFVHELNGHRMLFSFTRTDVTPNHLYFGSKREAFWKTHSYGLFVSNTSGNTSIDIIKGKKGQRICVGVFTHIYENSNLTLELQGDQKTILAGAEATKKRIWEELKLSVILRDDTNIKLMVRLSIGKNEHAFIGDIRDCSKNVRVVKTNYDEAHEKNTICYALKFPSVLAKGGETILTAPAVNVSITDTIWVADKNDCKTSNITTNLFEEKLNCSINDTNITKFVHGEDICFLAFEKGNSTVNRTCNIYDETKNFVKVNVTFYVIIWILIGLVILCCCIGGVIYLYKRNKLTCSTKWTFTIPITYEFFTRELFASNRAVDDTPHLHLSASENVSFSCPVEIENFKAYVEEALDKGELLSQYNMINGLKPQLCEVGSMAVHVRKNRYKNIVAYDATRVMLEMQYSNTNDDYINANYIKGYCGEKAFIASQGPAAVTILDFWRMIWQENVYTIVMLSKTIENGKTKCLEYWPELNDTNEYCTFKITCTGSNYIEDDITIRILKVLFNSIEREITQIHYEGWLDHSVPESPESLKKVLYLMRDFRHDDNPVVIHCSAGVGRTGTLILCDIAIRMAEATRKTDVFAILYELRHQRTKMVQTFDQYVYAHRVIASALESINL